MADFKFQNLRELLVELLASHHRFQSYSNFIGSPEKKVVLLRHDVDLLPENSLATAKLENSLGIQGTYYFRIIPETFRPDIIKQIADLGHEIGYHYEDMDLVQTDNLDEHIDLAYESFQNNLDILRKIVPINTICMHGSPRAKYDNKLIWSKYNYKELGIIGEPYLDIDWNQFGYLTDTGRCWNGNQYSIRDKVNSSYKFNFKSTSDVIAGINILPDKMMITIHPQRWTDSYLLWMKELIGQKSKNLVKYFINIKNRN